MNKTKSKRICIEQVSSSPLPLQKTCDKNSHCHCTEKMTNANIRQKQSINKIQLYALHHFDLKSENKLEKLPLKI